MKIKPFVMEYPELEEIEVMAVGDFHIGDKYFAPKHLKSIAKWVKKKPNRFITIDGDIFNAALTNSISDVYSEEYTLEESMNLFSEFIDDITPEKILAVVVGNHDQRVWKSVGIDPVKYVCSTKGVRYGGSEAFITIKLGCWDKTKEKKKMVMYNIYMTHGVGGGRSAGGKLNSVMRLAEIVTADVYIQGHQHDPVIKPKTIYSFTSQGNAVVERQQMFVVTGSCLERGGYAVAKAYPPVSTVSPVITFDGTKKNIRASI